MFCGMVSSSTVTFLPETTTRSGLDSVAVSLSGIVEGGFSEALHPGKSVQVGLFSQLRSP